MVNNEQKIRPIKITDIDIPNAHLISLTTEIPITPKLLKTLKKEQDGCH